MKDRLRKNKLLIIPVIAILLSTTFIMAYDAEESDAAQPSVTLTNSSIGYAPQFTVSSWKINEYNSIICVYTSIYGDLKYTSSWAGTQIPGISISSYGSSIQSGNTYINPVSNGNGTYSYYFKLSGTPTSTGVYDVRNQLIPPQIQNGMRFNFSIVGNTDGGPLHTEHSNRIVNNQYQVYTSSSIEFAGATWIPDGRDVWSFTYRMAGTGSQEGYFGKIRAAAMEIKGTNNTNNMAIWSSNDAKYIGSAPTSNNSTNYSGIANSVIGFAITALNSMGASFAWSTISLVAALGSFVNSSSNAEDYLWRSWSWSPDITDTGQFFWFIVDVEPNQTVKFSYEYMLFGPTFEALSAGKGYRTLYASSAANKNLSANPEQMTSLEKEQYGIETISKNNYLTKAVELNIPEKTINEWLKSGEDVFYFTNNVVEYESPQPEKVELSKSTLTKDLLLNELSDQIEKSEQIIKVFNTKEICELEDSIAIVKKHTFRIASLSDIQTKLEATREVNINKLNDVFDSYCKIINE